MPAAIGAKTIQDWLATPEGEHWELIHGELCMTEESYGNSRLAGLIERKIANFLEEHPLGVVERNVAFVFPGIHGTRNGLVPDLCFIPGAELAKVDFRANAQEGVIPELVAEMLSPSTRERDLVDKVEIYRAAGVSEYWIFDLEEETVRIYRFNECLEKPVASLTFDDSLSTPLLPGFELSLPEIQRRLDPRQGLDRTR